MEEGLQRKAEEAENWWVVADVEMTPVPGTSDEEEDGRQIPQECCLCIDYAGVPFDRCRFCTASPSWHHERCCPRNLSADDYQIHQIPVSIIPEVQSIDQDMPGSRKRFHDNSEAEETYEQVAESVNEVA